MSPSLSSTPTYLKEYSILLLIMILFDGIIVRIRSRKQKKSGTTKTKPKNGSRKMQMRISILLPSCNRSTDALLLQRKMLMESKRSVKMNTPTNRSNHRGVPRTKIERTISLRLIHTYSVDDPQ